MLFHKLDNLNPVSRRRRYAVSFLTQEDSIAAHNALQGAFNITFPSADGESDSDDHLAGATEARDRLMKPLQDLRDSQGRSR